MSDSRRKQMLSRFKPSSLIQGTVRRRGQRARSNSPLKDGVLTAYEVTRLNLQGTEFVTLSATLEWEKPKVVKDCSACDVRFRKLAQSPY